MQFASFGSTKLAASEERSLPFFGASKTSFRTSIEAKSEDEERARGRHVRVFLGQFIDIPENSRPRGRESPGLSKFPLLRFVAFS